MPPKSIKARPLTRLGIALLRLDARLTGGTLKVTESFAPVFRIGPDHDDDAWYAEQAGRDVPTVAAAKAAARRAGRRTG